MTRTRFVSILTAVALVALAVVLGAVSAAPANAFPSKQQTCSNCHSGTPIGTVSATPSTATPAPGAAYTVDISNGLSASGQTGYWIANSDAGGATGTTTGVYAGPASQTAWVANMTAPLTPGTYYFKVWNVRGPDNSNGQAKAVTYSIAVSAPPVLDTTAPTSTAGGVTANGWYHLPQVVNLTASDNAGGSGVKSITYTLDGGSPVTVNAATAPVNILADAVTHGDDGAHTIVYWATDNADNVEATRSLTVNIDTNQPTTTAPSAASVKRGNKATLRYQVDDVAPNGGNAVVVIKIKNAAGKVVKTLKLGAKPVNTAGAAKFTCKLARGKYRFFVSATDTAGNVQSNIARNKLVVR